MRSICLLLLTVMLFAIDASAQRSRHSFVGTTRTHTPVPGAGSSLESRQTSPALPGFSSNGDNNKTTSGCPGPTDIPYSENFDTVSAPAIPDCITVENTNGGNTWRTVGSDSYVSSPNIMRLDFEPDLITPANDWFFTRGLNLSNTNSYRLTFKYRNSDGSAYIEKLEVKYGSGANSASMTAGTLLTNTNINFDTWLEGGIDFTPSSSGVYYIGFHGFSDANQAFLAIDDIKVEITPACPSPIGVSISNITSTSADVNFTAGVSNNYLLEYGPHGFIPGVGATAGIGGTIILVPPGPPVSLTGLNTLDTFDVYVRQVCSAGTVYGPNSNLVWFRTPLANDEAPGAIPLTVNAGCTNMPYSNTGATQSVSERYGECSSTQGFATVWYKFVAPASGAVRISTATGTGTNTLTNSRISLFSTTNVNNYSNFSLISCDDDNGAAPFSLMSVLYSTSLKAGDTYYIQVDGFADGDTGSFCLTVDTLNSSMLSTITSCTSGQTPYGSITSYKGWVSLVDASSNLIALVKNAATGAAPDSYSTSQYINSGSVRTNTGQNYLDRNFRISSTATNDSVQLFFRASELNALHIADSAVTLANMGMTIQTEVVPGCHNDFDTNNGIESYLSPTKSDSTGGVCWIQVFTSGFSNFYLHTSKAPITLKAFLQGAYEAGAIRHKNVTTAWRDVLRNNATNQPYNISAFGNYNGGENVSSIMFNSTAGTKDITDWVLLELRNAPPPAARIAARAAFILEDGTIVDLDGISSVSFRGVADGNYFITVRHRNHLGIRTASVQLLNGALGSNPTPALYDYSSAQSQAFQDPAISANNAAMGIDGSVYLMWAGNANLDITVRVTTQGLPFIQGDGVFILGTILGSNSNATGPLPAGIGYSAGDINLDGKVRAITQGIPFTPSDVGFILGTTLSSNPNASRREHK